MVFFSSSLPFYNMVSPSGECRILTMAGTARRVALNRFGQLSIRSQAGLSIETPEITGIRPLLGRILLDPHQHLFGSQRRAQVWTIDIESFSVSHNFSSETVFSFRFSVFSCN